MSEPPWVVVGLGNPGPEYERTRHNVGAMVAAVLSERAGGRFARHRRAHADAVECRLAGHRAVIAVPRSYMNESGGPVASLLGFYKAPVERLVVLHDELDIPFGALRLKLGGGDNGHNGLRSLRRSLGTGDFYRVRVGIGRPPGRQDPADFVLRPFGSDRAARAALPRRPGGRCRRGVARRRARGRAEPLPCRRGRRHVTPPSGGVTPPSASDAVLAREIAVETGRLLLEIRAQHGPLDPSGTGPVPGRCATPPITPRTT